MFVKKRERIYLVQYVHFPAFSHKFPIQMESKKHPTANNSPCGCSPFSCASEKAFAFTMLFRNLYGSLFPALYYHTRKSFSIHILTYSDNNFVNYFLQFFCKESQEIFGGFLSNFFNYIWVLPTHNTIANAANN